jgi:cytochrome c-type biogenesis protein CcmE
MTTMNADVRRRNRIFAVGALAIAAVAFFFIAAGGIGQNLVYYWGPAELHAAGTKAYGASIRLGGQVGAGSIRHLDDGAVLEFDVVDGDSSVRVRSQGVPPQMFRENIGVVVEGTMTRNGFFDSQRLMVSHDNEYRAPQPGEEHDTKKLIETAE